MVLEIKSELFHVRVAVEDEETAESGVASGIEIGQVVRRQDREGVSGMG